MSDEKKFGLSTTIDVDLIAELKMEALKKRITVSGLLNNILFERYEKKIRRQNEKKY
ncbi:MAG: hypothetical protein ACRCX2_33950 [Paraclostridium sp.]